MTRRKYMILASTALGWTMATAAFAQEPDSADIIVTARRTEERLQDVPISITVFNQQQLANRNVVNPGDLAKYTPSLATNPRFGNESTSFALRGFIQEGPTSPSVGVYFADVTALRANGGTTGGNGAGPGSFFDLQNVQVLKGPQGTLFGRNTTGGAVLLVPQKPTGKLEGYVEGSYGNYDMKRVQAVLNMPIMDTLRIRLGVDHQQRDGYLKNVALPGLPLVGPKNFADVDYTAARVSIVADLTPNLENYLIASYTVSDTNGFLPKMVQTPIPVQPTGYRAAFYQAQIAATSGNYYDVSNGEPLAGQRISQWQLINTTTWHASDNVTVKNIASYGEFRQRQGAAIYGDNGVTAGVAGGPTHYNIAIDLVPDPNSHNLAQSTFTEELQLQGHGLNDRLDYQMGGYLELADPLGGFQRTFSASFLDCVNVIALQCTDARGRSIGLEGRVGSTSISQSKYKFRNLGVYAQGTYKITDHISLTGGIRYTSDKTTGVGDSLKIFFPAANTPNYTCSQPAGVVTGGTSAQIQANPALCQFTRVAKSSKPTWLVDLDWKPIDDVLVYAKYARGYRQGSINVSSYGLETWGPEKVDTYELGAKTSFRGAVHGTFNVAAFYNDFTDQQLQLGTVPCSTISLPQCPFIPAPAAGIANAGKSRIKGVEVEGSVTLFKGFTIDGGYTYIDSKIKTITIPPVPVGFISLSTAPAGGRIPLTPKHKYTVTGSYTLPLDASIGRVTFAATYSYQSDIDGSVSSRASGLYLLPSQHLLNLNVNWNGVAGTPIDLSLFATNVTKEKFYTFTTGASFGFDSAILSEPRMYGVRLRYSFKR